MRAIIACCVMVVVGALAAPAAGASTATGTTRLGTTITLTSAEKTVLTLVNHARTSRGLHRLVVVRSLERAARAHSCDMLTCDYFSHYSYSGASFTRRLVSFGYSAAGRSTWKTGEVIGWGKGAAAGPRSVFRLWMKSAGHRAVILTKAWRDVGVGARVGTYKGLSGVRMFTVDFGRRVK
jgi:uncharacterized protein YkwD